MAKKKGSSGSGGGSSGWRSGAKRAVCYRCNKSGHIARQCWDTSSYDRRRSGGRYDDDKKGKKKDE